jgi:hypothetical protein
MNLLKQDGKVYELVLVPRKQTKGKRDPVCHECAFAYTTPTDCLRAGDSCFEPKAPAGHDYVWKETK